MSEVPPAPEVIEPVSIEELLEQTEQMLLFAVHIKEILFARQTLPREEPAVMLQIIIQNLYQIRQVLTLLKGSSQKDIPQEVLESSKEQMQKADEVLMGLAQYFQITEPTIPGEQ